MDVHSSRFLSGFVCFLLSSIFVWKFSCLDIYMLHSISFMNIRFCRHNTTKRFLHVVVAETYKLSVHTLRSKSDVWTTTYTVKHPITIQTDLKFSNKNVGEKLSTKTGQKHTLCTCTFLLAVEVSAITNSLSNQTFYWNNRAL